MNQDFQEATLHLLLNIRSQIYFHKENQQQDIKWGKMLNSENIDFTQNKMQQLASGGERTADKNVK